MFQCLGPWVEGIHWITDNVAYRRKWTRCFSSGQGTNRFLLDLLFVSCFVTIVVFVRYKFFNPLSCLSKAKVSLFATEQTHTFLFLSQEVTDTLDKDAVFRVMTQCYEMHQSERPKLEDIVRPEEGYMKSAKSLASLGGSLIQGVVVSYFL